MSFDLYVFDGDVLDDESLIAEWLEDDSRGEAPLTPRLAALVSELERKRSPDESHRTNCEDAQVVVAAE